MRNYFYPNHYDHNLQVGIELMNKYFMSQILYDRFEDHQYDEQIATVMNLLRKEVKNENISQMGLRRILKKNVDFFNMGNSIKGALWREP